MSGAGYTQPTSGVTRSAGAADSIGYHWYRPGGHGLVHGAPHGSREDGRTNRSVAQCHSAISRWFTNAVM